jgi:hypothetical protein
MNMRQLLRSLIDCLLLFTPVFLSGTAFGLVPHLISYQGHRTNSMSQPINGTLSMTFELYDAMGRVLYTETQVRCSTFRSSTTIQELPKGVFR